MPLQQLTCLHTGWYVNCSALSTSTFTAFTSSLMPYPCSTCCCHWPMLAPSQTMVSMITVYFYSRVSQTVKLTLKKSDLLSEGGLCAHKAGPYFTELAALLASALFFFMGCGQHQPRGWWALPLSCLKVYLHGRADCLPPSIPASLYSDYPCCISVPWCAVFTETNLLHRGASWL